MWSCHKHVWSTSLLAMESGGTNQISPVEVHVRYCICVLLVNHNYALYHNTEPKGGLLYLQQMVNFNVHVKLQCVKLKERGGRGYMPSNSYAVDKHNIRAAVPKVTSDNLHNYADQRTCSSAL